MKKFSLFLLLLCLLFSKKALSSGYVTCPSSPNDISLYEPEALPITFNGTVYHNVFSYVTANGNMESIYYNPTSSGIIYDNIMSFYNANIVWTERMPNGFFYSCYNYENYSSNVGGIAGWKNYTNDGNIQNPNGILPFLSTPIADSTPYTRTINTVFDHSITTAYCSNGIIMTYTGESATDLTKSGPCNTYNDPETYSYAPQPVNISNYRQGTTLSYDGHIGYDYRTIDIGTDVNVLAAAAGTATLGSSDYGEVTIDHANGYRTRYLHLRNNSRLTDQRIINGNVDVGIPIGIAGGTGPSGSDQFAVHLHFELQKNVNGTWISVDPYGWIASGNDPYTSATNIKLWIDNPVLSAGSSGTYSSLQNAYNSISDSGQIIQMQQQNFVEDLILSNNLFVTLQGGYDSTFQTNLGWTTIFGSLTIQSGTVVVDHICIQ